MNPFPLSPQTLAHNRQRLAALLDTGALAVIGSNDPITTNADGTLGVFPNSDLLYLTGLRQEETSLLLFPEAPDAGEREVLFIRRPNPKVEVWEGAKLTREQAAELSGVAQVLYADEFPAVFHRLMCACKSVYLNANEHPRHLPTAESRDLRFARWVRHHYPLHDLRRLAPLLYRLRMVKSPEEVEAIRLACKLTAHAFRQVCMLVRPGVSEKRIEAEFARVFTEAGARFAYQPIVASGASSCVLHSIANDRVCNEGDILLIDVGAELGGYCSDLTRVLPVSGRFTDRQRAVHDAVMRVHRAAMADVRPGVLWNDVHHKALDRTKHELHALGILPYGWQQLPDSGDTDTKRYFMHGVGHSLGLDVHDVGDLRLPLEPGCVMTIEPGIYIPEEEIGIRIETNIVVTADGCDDLFADLPADAESIEYAMHCTS